MQDVRVGLVRARDPVRVGHEFMVGDDGAGGEAHGTREAHRGVGPLGHLLGRGEDHFVGLEVVLQFDFVQLAVAAHEGRDGLAVHHVEQRLDELLRGNLEETADFFDGVLIRGGHFLDGGAGFLTGFGGREDGGALDVGGPVASGAVGDGVFAGFGQHHELMREVAADGAGVGFHGTELQRHAAENLFVRLEHLLVADVRARIVPVEGIGVLHQKFAPAHQAEAGADLVAELGLDLVQVHGKLAVGAHFAADEVGDDFLVRGAEAVVALMAVLEAQEFLAVVFPTPGFAPQVGGLHGRHEDFLSARPVHFLAHDVRGLVQGPQTQRQPRIDAGSELANHARADQQFVADDFSVARGFFQSGDVPLTPAHRCTSE